MQATAPHNSNYPITKESNLSMHIHRNKLSSNQRLQISMKYLHYDTSMNMKYTSNAYDYTMNHSLATLNHIKPEKNTKKPPTNQTCELQPSY